MPVATAHNLVKTYAGQTVFRGVSFEIQERDRVALVGANGTGKTTLLRILAGIERPDAGGVSFTSGTRLGCLSQEVKFPPGVTLRQHVMSAFRALLDIEKRLEALQERISAAPRGDQLDILLRDHDRLLHEYEVGGGYTYESRLREVLAGLGIEEGRLDQPLETFSGGQRTRVALAELLLSRRDLLLLDEPTNHLDLEATEWLEEFLGSAQQAIVITSHDRWFLDKVARRVWELAGGKLERFTGTYSQYAAQRAERQERQLKEFEAQSEHIARTQAFIDRYRAGQRARQARGRQKLLNRLERVERPRGAGAMALNIKSTLRSGETVLATEDLVLPHVGVRVDDVELRRGERAAVVGPNGAGKTTFLRVVTGEQEPVAGQVYLGFSLQMAYYAQAHEQLSTGKTVLDEILSAKSMGESEARTYLGRFLFSGDDVFKSVGSLSGGERSRLALAKLALGNANFLVLDEPTNHLDIYSREALEEVLREFNGSILFVSHDRFLIDALATQIWVVENGRLTSHKQTWTEYEAERQAAKDQILRSAQDDKVAEAQAAAAVEQAGRTKSREATKRKVRLEQLEKEIATANAELHVLVAEIERASAAADGGRIADLGRQHEATSQALHALEYEWLHLQDETDRGVAASRAPDRR